MGGGSTSQVEVVDGEYLYDDCKKVRRRINNSISILHNLVADGKISHEDAKELDECLRTIFIKISKAMNNSLD